MKLMKKTRVKLFRVSTSLSLIRARIKILLFKKTNNKKDKDFYLY
jgi:hypothetical protein